MPNSVTIIIASHSADDVPHHDPASQRRHQLWAKYSVLFRLSTDSATFQRRSTSIRPPNTAGNSMARIANGPPTSTVGMTANSGPEDDGGRLADFFSVSTSGPNPGFSFVSGSGGFDLPDRLSTMIRRRSAVPPLKVLRKYGSPCVRLQRTRPSASTPTI